MLGSRATSPFFCRTRRPTLCAISASFATTRVRNVPDFMDRPFCCLSTGCVECAHSFLFYIRPQPFLQVIGDNASSRHLELFPNSKRLKLGGGQFRVPIGHVPKRLSEGPRRERLAGVPSSIRREHHADCTSSRRRRTGPGTAPGAVSGGSAAVRFHGPPLQASPVGGRP